MGRGGGANGDERVNTTPMPDPEAERLEALRLYHVLDTPPEAAFDDLTRLAAQLCQTPAAFIAFVDTDRHWIKSRHGWPVAEGPREGAPCAQAILSADVLEMSEAAELERFNWPPMPDWAGPVRFYAAMPIATPEGHKVGTLCVAAPEARRLTREQKEALRILAHQVTTHLELRRRLTELERSLGEEERAKEALRASEAFYEALVESLPQFIIRKNRAGRFTFANRKFCEGLGRPLSEIVGKTDLDFYPRHLAEKYHRDDQRVMATGKPIDTIEANQSPEGGSLFVHVIKTPLLDASGEVTGIQGIFWDVTERKKIEEQLAYERDLLRSLLDTIPDRIYFKDAASRFLRCSQSMARRMGLSDAREVMGKTDFDYHPPAAAQEYYQEEQRIILTGKPLVNKLQRTVDPDGKETWTTATKVPVYNRHGTITGLVGISRDITQLKEAEEALERARDAALEHARVKSEFLANMSHEIRTPMHAIVGMADLLLGTPLSPEQREYVETLRSGIDTLLKLINDILDFSKAEAGKLTIESIDYDLREVIESTADLLAERAHRKGVELAYWIDPALPTSLRGDPVRLRQVLTNLVSNAIKFTERGEVVIRAGLEKGEDGRPRLRLSVTDTGIGIPARAAGSMFKAFTQADGSTTRKYGGTGLGLAISKQLVELMQGQIGVESAPSQGSCFWIALPLPALPAPARARPLLLGGPGARLLVVDDNAVSRQFLDEQLALWGVPHQSAGSALEAMDILRKAARAGQPFAAALLDMQMPEMDGLTLARAIKADPLIAGVNLVLLTSLCSRLDREDRVSSGIRICLAKPPKQARLFEALSTVLAASPEPSEAEPASQDSAPSARPAGGSAASRLRVLLAEDNPVNQRLALRQLEKLGYAADAVMNGNEAVEAAARTAYDVILMDCQMPELDGYEATRQIRQREKDGAPASRRRAHIIALTANALGDDRARGLEAGMNDYLTKPVRMEDLSRALGRAGPLGPAAEASRNRAADEGLDTTVLASLRELAEPGRPDPVRELVELFLRDSTPKVDSLQNLAGLRKAGELKAAAHSLKGSSNNLGARRLAGMLQEIENAAKAGKWEDLEDLLPRVRSEFHRVQERLLAEASR